MGILNAVTGNASQLDPQRAHELYGPWLLEGEQIQVAFQLVRDGFAITDHRIISLDREGTTGRKTHVNSIGINTIVDVSAETAGAGIDDADLTIIYISSPRLRAHSVSLARHTFTFGKGFDLPQLYRYLMGIAQRNLATLNAE